MDFKTSPQRLLELDCRRRHCRRRLRLKQRLALCAALAVAASLGVALASNWTASGSASAAPPLQIVGENHRPESHAGCPIPLALRPAMLQSARRSGVSLELLAALVWQESRFEIRARSEAGALGLTQLMPETALGLGVHPLRPEENIDGGSRYLRLQLDHFGSVRLALAAYNAGPGAVVRFHGVPPYRETRDYVQVVLAQARRWRGPIQACF